MPVSFTAGPRTLVLLVFDLLSRYCASRRLQNSDYIQRGCFMRGLSFFYRTAVLLMVSAVTAAAPLRIGTSASSNPLIFQADGNIVGLEADLARLLQARIGQPIEFRLLPESDLLPALARGEVDVVMSGLTITPEREQ